MKENFIEINKGMICSLLPTAEIAAILDIEQYHNMFLKHGYKFEYKHVSTFDMKQGVKYKVILTNIIYNKLSYQISPYIDKEFKTSSLCPNTKVWTELFFIEENIKAYVSFPKFQDSLCEIF